MNRMTRGICLLACAAVLAWPGIGRGQTAAPATGDDVAQARERSAARRASDASRLVSRLSKLRSQMNARLDLTSDQKRVVHQLFEDYVRVVKGGAAKPEEKKSSREADDREAELQELYDELEEARNVGDGEWSRQVRDRIREILQEKRKGATDETSQFIASLERELTPPQKPKFEELLRRYGFAKRDRMAMAPIEGAQERLGSLLKAALNPEVGLTEERRQAVIQILREAVLTADPDGDRQQFIADVAAQVHYELMGELSEDEWGKVENLMNPEAKEAKDAPMQNNDATRRDGQ